MREFSAPISDLPDLIQVAIGAILGFGSVRAVALVGSRANDLHRPDADDWDLQAYTSQAPYPDQQVRRDTWASLPAFAGSRVTAVGGMNDQFNIDDLHFGFTYYPTAEVDDKIGAVLAGKWPGYRYHAPEAFAAGMSAAQPLWDPDGVILGWRQSLHPMPEDFRYKAIQELIFEARADLLDLERACQLGDVTFFRVALGEIVQRLLRLASVVHGTWYRGPKRAIARLRAVPAVESSWLDEIEGLMSMGLSEALLAPTHQQSRRLLVHIAETAVAQGDDGVRAVRRGLSFWPDVAELVVPALGRC